MTTKKIHINILKTPNDLPTKKNIQTDKQSKQKYDIQKPQVSPFNDNGIQKKRDWNEYYEKQLLEIKSLYPNVTHNELTSIISKKWKKAKKNFRYFDQLAQQIKKEHFNKDDLQIFQNNQEQDQIIEKLRSTSLKLIFCNQILELKGQTVLDAINQNKLIIYLNNQEENTKQEDINKFLLYTKDDVQEYDKEQDDNDNNDNDNDNDNDNNNNDNDNDNDNDNNNNNNNNDNTINNNDNNINNINNNDTNNNNNDTNNDNDNDNDNFQIVNNIKNYL